tara:strand:+ start:785 stop:895 length:111 start_codon:yes stop_codon:yes gene_type:complete
MRQQHNAGQCHVVLASVIPPPPARRWQHDTALVNDP